MNSVPAVVVAGHVCIDEIVTTEGIGRTVGSPAVFISPVLRERGLPTAVIAPYGSDFTEMQHGLDLLPHPQGDCTLVFVNDVRGARRTQAVRNAGCAMLGRPDRIDLDALAGAQALIVTPLLADPSAGILREYVEALPTGALRVILLQGYLRRLSTHLDARGNTPVVHRSLAEIDDLLPLFDIAVLSDEDLSGDVDETVSGWSAAHPSSAVVVTRGPEGASVFTAGERTDAAAHDVGVLPSDALVGAGDIFSAELTAALLSAGPEAPLLPAVAAANHATALRLARRRDRPAGDAQRVLEPATP